MSETGMQSCYVDYTTRSIADLVDYYGLGMLITRINVPVKERGKGAGGKLLAQILADADRTRTTLFLEVVPTGGLNEEQLTAWYKKHGFSNWKGIMRRRPRWRSMQENPVYRKKRFHRKENRFKVGDVVKVVRDTGGQDELVQTYIGKVGRIAEIEEWVSETIYRVVVDDEQIGVWVEESDIEPVGFQSTSNPVFGKKRHKYPVGSEVVVGLGGEGQIGDVRKVEEATEDDGFIYTIAFSRPTGVFFSKHWEDELDRVWHRPRYHAGQEITAYVGGKYRGKIESVWWDKDQKWWTYNVLVELPPDPGYKEKSILVSEPEHILIGWEEMGKGGYTKNPIFPKRRGGGYQVGDRVKYGEFGAAKGEKYYTVFSVQKIGDDPADWLYRLEDETGYTFMSGPDSMFPV